MKCINLAPSYLRVKFLYHRGTECFSFVILRLDRGIQRSINHHGLPRHSVPHNDE